MRTLLSMLSAAVLVSCAEHRVSQVAGPGGALAVDDGGAEPASRLPAVFVHSLAGNASHWAAQLEHLRRNHRAVALDLRGHGRSERPRDGDYTLTAMAGDVAAVVDSLGLDQFVLVGHSMGGGVALLYAGAHPERVAGLVLVDPIGDGKQISTAEAKAFLAGFESDYQGTSARYWAGIAGPDSAIRERLLADLRATPRAAVVQVLGEVLRFDPDPALARYQGPTLAIVTPSNDMPFSLHRLGKGFPHHVVQGTGHWIQLDKPEVFNRLLDEFLEKSVNSEQ
ncbi:MAG TPA: alpha/beta hydrolase [Gemmatimonadales bacterium]|nr:alpha/beta hydrolase [Gemmatimonadales bacterium]